MLLKASNGCAFARTRINEVKTSARITADNLMPKSIHEDFLKIFGA
jgi:hypothetical protein